MAVESLLRGVIVVGVLIIGGLVYSAIDDSDAPASRPKIAASAPVDTAGLPAPWSEQEAALSVDISAVGTGQIAVELPGGFGLKLPTDGDSFDQSDFEIDGVGLYPGASAKDMKVRVLKQRAADGSRAFVTMTFDAPDRPERVADWYAQAFADEGIAVTRRSNQFAGRTSDGNLFDLVLDEAATGSRGTVRIRSGNRRG